MWNGLKVYTSVLLPKQQTDKARGRDLLKRKAEA